MQAFDEVPLSVIVSWFDPLPQLTREYLLKYWVGTNEVEMVDLKTRKLFLRRTPCSRTISLKDLYASNILLLHGRELKVEGPGDKQTAAQLEAEMASVGVVLGASLVERGSPGKVLDMLTSSGLSLTMLKTFQLGREEALRLADELKAPSATEALQEGTILVMELRGNSAQRKVREVFSTNEWSGDAWWAPGEGVSSLLLHPGGIATKHSTTAVYDNCTCCVIKPHAVRAGLAGKIIDAISCQGYHISAMQMFHLDRLAASQFYEIYKGILQEYKEMVDEAIVSPCIALEIRAEDAVRTFRKSAGPWDVEVAKELRPGSLRAIYGSDRVKMPYIAPIYLKMV
eukprot:314024_1